ncbi:HAMP domain-containing protein [Roseomonas stagni]|uniref:HAMP domain-containing protein n=1 Tax=Falsiroseomonas algicola TaxID=2716930 RepID=A0A6M1LRY0_9PROT|nr:CHASE3 domain-containing protein [Falsiroseomonas algicola]NGM23166.1 HAMP domain-containing protein [Falsiroseomonas algicola]
MLQRLLDLSIARKLAAAFAVVILASATAGGLTWLRLDALESAARWNAHTRLVLERTDRIVAAMVDQETGVRGHLLNGDPAFLDPYRAGQAAYTEAMAEIRRLTADNPTQQARLADLDRAARGWTEGHAGRQVALMARGDEASRAEARRMEEQGAGKAAMDAVRAKAAEIAAMERQLLAQRTDAQMAAFTEARLMLGLGTGAAALLALVCAFSLARTVARPLTRLADQVTRIAGGDLSVAIEGEGRRDEAGALAKAVAVLKDNTARARALEAEAEAQRLRTEQDRRAAQHAMADQLDRTVGSVTATLSSAATELQATVGTLTGGAERTAHQAMAAAAGATQASANVQTVAASTEEMAATGAEITRQVAEAAAIARRASEETRATDATVQSLAEAASRIGEVVRLIGDIAGQTNLLALNATIEAARAGEAGKGFAVVASEVKTLAAQTAKATEEISAQIAAMQGATSQAVEAIRGIGATVERSSEIAAAIATAVEEQGAATREIARNVTEAASGTSEVSSQVERVNAGIAETSDALRHLRAGSDSVASQGELLRAEVGSLVEKLRAA